MMNDQTVETHAQELEERGFTVVKNVLEPSDLEAARTILAQIFEKESVVARQRGWHNDTYKVAYMLPQKHELFRRLPLNPHMLPLMRRVLGDDCILSSFNGLTMSPGGKSQELHLDQRQSVPGTVININALYTLDDFTRANGCTRVVPKSQNRMVRFPIDEQAEEKNTTYIEAPAGSLIAFNGGMLHAGSANTTQNLRRCLHSYYCRAWVRPQWDFPSSLSSEVKGILSADLKQLMGFSPTEERYDYQTDDRSRVVRT